MVDRSSFHGIEGGVDTINDFAEDGEPSVQMGLLAVCYEELGLVCICTRVGHGHHAAGVKLGSEQGGEKGDGQNARITAERKRAAVGAQEVGTADGPVSHFDGGSDFVLERFSPDGLATFTQAGGITGLNHEGLDVAMKNAAIVIVGSTKGQKVLQRGSRVKG